MPGCIASPLPGWLGTQATHLKVSKDIHPHPKRNRNVAMGLRVKSDPVGWGCCFNKEMMCTR